jgi:uncharacterized Zn finger protein
MMNGGLIHCQKCGQEQYVVTVRIFVHCIRCGEKHEVFPIPEPEGKDDGTEL